MPISPTLDDVNSGDVTITLLVDMMIRVEMVVVTSCPVCIAEVGSGNSIMASVVST